MQTRGLIDFYLPSKVVYHIKIILSSVLVTIFFNLIWLGTPFVKYYWVTIILVTIQLEIFMAIAFKIFPSVSLKSHKNYKSKVIVRLIIFYLLVFVIALIFLFFTIAIIVFLHQGNLSDLSSHLLSAELKPFFISLSIGIGFGSLFFFYSEWSHALKREQKLREEKLVFQYETLKSQVNPHFLFNSLNTLSSLISKDPELSEKFINKFSSIYRYILENADKDTVDLSEEIAFINNFFFLQKIRDEGKIELQILVNDPENYEILPISLQMLVENALKHNMATKENPLHIKICLEGEDELVVENNLQKKMLLEPSPKIGLKNLRERVSLVMKRQMIVEEREEKFVVKLPLMKISHASSDHRR